MAHLELSNRLLGYMPRVGNRPVKVLGALTAFEKYVHAVTGIIFEKEDDLSLVQTLEANAFHIYGYVINKKDTWERIEVNLQGDVSLVYVSSGAGYSIALLQENKTYPALLSLNLREYKGEDRFSYSTLSHAQFRPGEPNFLRQKELFQKLFTRTGRGLADFVRLISDAKTS